MIQADRSICKESRVVLRSLKNTTRIILSNINIPFGTEQLEWFGYLMVKKFEDTYNRLDRIPTCDRQDRQTDGQTPFDSIVHAMHTRRAVKIDSLCSALWRKVFNFYASQSA